MSGDAGPADGRPSGVQLAVGAGTDRGLRRELNEDDFLATDPLFAVADGMGGHEAGEVASQECIRTLGQQPFLTGGSREATASDLQMALRRADARIRELTNARAGTTVSGVVLVEERAVPYWLVFNVGDSRTYCLSQGTLRQISVDHSEVQELVDGGFITAEQALVHPRRHVVTRALGAGSEIDADFWLVPVKEGDRILVCSDGLTGELSDSQLHGILSTLHKPQDAVDALIQAALRAGGRDNITAIVLDASNIGGPAGTDTLDKTEPRHHDDGDTLPRAPHPAAEAAAQATTQPAAQPAAVETATTKPPAGDAAVQEHAGTHLHEENHG